VAETLLLTSSLKCSNEADKVVKATFSVLRIAVLLSMSITHVILCGEHFFGKVNKDETETLLSNGSAEYGTTKKANSSAASTKAPQRGGWVDYFIGFRILFPYLW
jgi:ATP-binding cassette, subfamily B, vacuolar membrane transporter HMT1/ACLQ